MLQLLGSGNQALLDAWVGSDWLKQLVSTVEKRRDFNHKLRSKKNILEYVRLLKQDFGI